MHSTSLRQEGKVFKRKKITTVPKLENLLGFVDRTGAAKGACSESSRTETELSNLLNEVEIQSLCSLLHERILELVSLLQYQDKSKLSHQWKPHSVWCTRFIRRRFDLVLYAVNAVLYLSLLR